AAFGRYPSRAMASCTAAFRAAPTFSGCCTTSETRDRETPASLATSDIVGGRDSRVVMSVLSLDRTGGQTFDEVALEEREEQQHRHDGEHGSRHEEVPLRPELTAERR